MNMIVKGKQPCHSRADENKKSKRTPKKIRVIQALAKKPIIRLTSRNNEWKMRRRRKKQERKKRWFMA